MWASQVLELNAGRPARHVARDAGTGANTDTVSNVSKDQALCIQTFTLYLEKFPKKILSWKQLCT